MWCSFDSTPWCCPLEMNSELRDTICVRSDERVEQTQNFHPGDCGMCLGVRPIVLELYFRESGHKERQWVWQSFFGNFENRNAGASAAQPGAVVRWEE